MSHSPELGRHGPVGGTHDGVEELLNVPPPYNAKLGLGDEWLPVFSMSRV